MIDMAACSISKLVLRTSDVTLWVKVCACLCICNLLSDRTRTFPVHELLHGRIVSTLVWARLDAS